MLSKDVAPLLANIYLNGELSSGRLSVSSLGLQSDAASSNIFVGDGGLKFLPRRALNCENTQILWAGDGDSLEPESAKLLESLIHGEFPASFVRRDLNPDKDFSDFGLLLDEILGNADYQRPLFLQIFGGLGKRRDHDAVNQEEIVAFLKAHPFPSICLFQSELIISTADFEVELPDHSTFTLLNASKKNESCRLWVTGAQYQGELMLKRPSQGLSNVTVGNRLSIKLDKGVVLKCFAQS